MQSWAFLHAGMLHQASLGKEVGGQLDRAAKPGSNHGSADASIQAGNALTLENPGHAIDGVAILVLGAHRPERRVALETSLDQEERAARSSSHHTGGGTAEHIDEEILRLLILVNQLGQTRAHGLVESKTAPIEQDLVDVGTSNTSVDAPETLVSHNHTDAVEGSLVVHSLSALEL